MKRILIVATILTGLALGGCGLSPWITYPDVHIRTYGPWEIHTAKICSVFISNGEGKIGKTFALECVLSSADLVGKKEVYLMNVKVPSDWSRLTAAGWDVECSRDSETEMHCK
jgi:hypothetical protein